MCSGQKESLCWAVLYTFSLFEESGVNAHIQLDVFPSAALSDDLRKL